MKCCASNPPAVNEMKFDASRSSKIHVNVNATKERATFASDLR